MTAGGRRVPKAELHVHLEGTAPPALVRRARAAQRAAGPRGPVRATTDLRLARLPRLPARLRPRRQRHPDRARTTATSSTSTSPRCAAEGAIYVELTASPDHAASRRALPTPSTRRARPGHRRRPRATTASRRGSSSPRVRNFGVERRARGRRARPSRTRTPTSSASTWPATRPASRPAPFAEAYAIAAEAGLGCTVHAGEWAGPRASAPRSTCRVTRISHGVRAIEDPALVAELAERGIVLEVCPTSNVVLGVFPELRGPPARARCARPGVPRHARLRRPAVLRRQRRRASTRSPATRFGLGEDELRGAHAHRHRGRLRGRPLKRGATRPLVR